MTNKKQYNKSDNLSNKEQSNSLNIEGEDFVDKLKNSEELETELDHALEQLKKSSKKNII